MIIGFPREIKPQEARVAAVPAGVQQLVARGHQVLVETGAGLGSGIDDAAFEAVGARIARTAAEVWEAELVWKVKEPIPEEFGLLRRGQIVFAYLHLAPDPALARALLGAGVVAIAFETIEDGRGHLPCLQPMSEIAGRLAVQAGARCLERASGGRGVLLGGVPGVPPGEVVVLGGGSVGKNAAWTAVGLGARVTVLDLDLQRLRWFDDNFHGRIETLYSSPHTIAALAERADLLVGAVLVAGAKAPVLVPREIVARMRHGAAIVDVAVDQGGCVETIRPTTHADPIYLDEGIVHYGVANMPGAVPRTSTFALHNATLPYGLRLADAGWEAACRADPGLARGLNVVDGRVTHEAVAAALGMPVARWG